VPLYISVQQEMGRFHLKSVYHQASFNVSVDVAKGESSSIANEQRDIIHPPKPYIIELADWVDSLPIYNFSLDNKAKQQQQQPRKVWDANKQQPVDFIPTPTIPQYVNEFMPVCFGRGGSL
jgi:hypothetical protein